MHYRSTVEAAQTIAAVLAITALRGAAGRARFGAHLLDQAAGRLEASTYSVNLAPEHPARVSELVAR